MLLFVLIALFVVQFISAKVLYVESENHLISILKVKKYFLENNKIGKILIVFLKTEITITILLLSIIFRIIIIVFLKKIIFFSKINIFKKRKIQMIRKHILFS